jgi:hypothetical protein
MNYCLLDVPQKNFSVSFNKVVFSKIVFKIEKMCVQLNFFCGTSRIT